MANSTALPFKPSCPNGGNFYVHTSGFHFLGCCIIDPGDNGCSDGNLRSASFDPAFYDSLKDQSCASGSLWYTCTGTKPPFMGCCKSNACAANFGCPVGDLTAGWVSSNPQAAAVFLGMGGPQSSSTTTSSAPTSTVSSLAGTASTTSSSAPWLLIGLAIAGVVVLLLLSALLVFCLRRRAKRSRERARLRSVHWTSEKDSHPHTLEHSPLVRDPKPKIKEAKEDIFELHGKDIPTPELYSHGTPPTPAPPYVDYDDRTNASSTSEQMRGHCSDLVPSIRINADPNEPSPMLASERGMKAAW